MEGRVPLVCSACGQENEPGAAFCGGCGAFLEWNAAPASVAPQPLPVAAPAAAVSPVADGPAVVAHLAARQVSVVPGGEASLEVEVVNRGRTVDQISVDILGPASAWSTVSPPSVNLLPGTSATATVALRPPRTSEVHAGQHWATVAVHSREHRDAAVAERLGIDVAAFADFEAALSPSILRGSVEGACTVQAVNLGNAPLEVAVTADDPELAFAFRLSAPRLQLDPGQTATIDVGVTPRTTLESGPSQTRPFRVAVAPRGMAKRTLEGTFIQEPKPAPREAPAAVVAPLLQLSTTLVRVDPGGQATAAVSVLARGAARDQVALRLDGSAAAWSSIEPAGLDLVPNAWTSATITCRPPRSASLPAGHHELRVEARSRQPRAPAATERLAVEVAPYVELDASLAPPVVQASRRGASAVHVANRGNALAELALSGEDPSAALEFRFSPGFLRLRPGASDGAALAIAPRAPVAGPTPFRVVMTAGDGARSYLPGTFIPSGSRRGHPILAVLFLVPVLLLVALAGLIAGWFVDNEMSAPDSALPAAVLVWGAGALASLAVAVRIAGGARRFVMGVLVASAVVALGFGVYLAATAADQGQQRQANVPPVGEVWFAQSVDATTHEVSGRTDQWLSGREIAWVARLPAPPGSQGIDLVTSVDGVEQYRLTLTSDAATGDLIARTFTPGGVGQYRLDLVDASGQTVASGAVNVLAP